MLINKQALKDARLICADFLQWQPDEAFDAAVCAMGLHYHEGAALGAFLSKVQRALKPCGLFVCVQPSMPCQLEEYFAVLEKGVFQFENHGYATMPPYFVGKKYG